MQQAKNQLPLKKLLAKNIEYLMNAYGLSRKDLSSTLDIPYTTICDWLKAKSYPRLDTLEYMSDFFNIEIKDFFIDISRQESLVARIEAYARSLNMEKDYSHLYPENFFDLFGCISDPSLTAPEDISVDEDIENL